MVCLHWQNLGVFILADTETETETHKNSLLEFCEGVHTAQGHRQVQTSIGLSPHLSVSVSVSVWGSVNEPSDWVPLTTRKLMQKKLFVRSGLRCNRTVYTAINDFGAENYVHCNRMLVLTRLVTGRTQCTGRERLIRSHSSARFCFELSGNSNWSMPCNSNFHQKISLN